MEKITKIAPKEVRPGFGSYLDYLTETLTVGEFGQLAPALGISQRRLMYNLNRPQFIDRDLILLFAETIHGSRAAAQDLITIYGLGREKLTIAEAETITQQP